MKRSSRHVIVMLGILSAVAVGAGSARAQAPSMPCPIPVQVTMSGKNPATFLATDFPPGAILPAAQMSGFNETQPNKHFAYTFQFKPGKGECCQFREGKLTVVYKALQGGGANSSSSANDDACLVHNGAVVGTGGCPRIWGTGGVTTGATTTVSYVVPAGMIASGHVSLYAEDDSAVVSAVLEFAGCCVEATRPN
jgi:hypothetical protein